MRKGTWTERLAQRGDDGGREVIAAAKLIVDYSHFAWSEKDLGQRDQDRLTSSEGLLHRAREGDSRALSTLFRRHGLALRRWARGRLPRWARTFSDTADLVQEALFQTFRRIDRFEDRGRGALEAYLRAAVTNRIRDEMRRVARRPTEVLPADAAEIQSDDVGPFEATLDAERDCKYKDALSTLSEDERLLVVGRIELGYSYDQLALITHRATADAARIAVRRAVLKLANRMSDS